MKPYFIGLEEARSVLADIGIILSEKQMQRAAEPDSDGKRKLPFIIDPIDGRLKINRDTLLSEYIQRQVAAEKNLRITT